MKWDLWHLQPLQISRPKAQATRTQTDQQFFWVEESGVKVQRVQASSLLDRKPAMGIGSGVCACVLSRCSCVRLCYSVDCGGADPLWPHGLKPACVACLKTLCFSFNSKTALKNWKTKSIILDGILAQLDGIKSDAKILDTILRREMVISVKQTNKQNKQNKNQI